MNADPTAKSTLQLKLSPAAAVALSELAAYHRRGEYISELIVSAHQRAQIVSVIAAEMRGLAEKLEQI